MRKNSWLTSLTSSDCPKFAIEDVCHVCYLQIQSVTRHAILTVGKSLKVCMVFVGQTAVQKLYLLQYTCYRSCGARRRHSPSQNVVQVQATGALKSTTRPFEERWGGYLGVRALHSLLRQSLQEHIQIRKNPQPYKTRRLPLQTGHQHHRYQAHRAR